jgi:LysM domain
MKNRRFLFLLPLIAFVLIGCAPTTPPKEEHAAPSPPVPPPPAYVFHKVMPGETFATIARWYSGKDSNWREIAEHNPELNAGSLRVGDVVKVPLYLTTVHNMQPNYSTAPHRKKKVASGKPVEEEEAPPAPEEVFGPK